MSLDIRDFQPEKYEPQSRYCPICRAFIAAGTPIHKCSERVLKSLERQYEQLSEDAENEPEPERTMDDKLAEAQDMIEPN